MKGNLVVNESHSQSDSDHAPISAIVDIPSEEEIKVQQVEEKKSNEEAFKQSVKIASSDDDSATESKVKPTP